MQITENCIINGMPDKLYHSDPTPVLEGFAHSASLSSSMAKELVERTEKEAFLSNQRLNPAYKPEDDTDSTTLGTVAHDYILRGGNGDKLYEIVPVDSWRTNDAKAAKDDIIRRGLIPLNTTTAPRLFDDVKAMHKALHEQMAGHRDFPGLMMKGKGEQSAFVKKGSIWLRARFDWLDENYPNVIVDYKTTALSFDSWEKNQLWGADGALYMQEAHYKDVGETLFSRPMTFVFVVQQTFAPYNVMIFKIDESFRDEVSNRYDLARRKFENCLKTGIWRGQPPYMAHSCPPTWIMSKWELDALNRDVANDRDKTQEPKEPEEPTYMAG